jgi:long chain fatty acid CoA FadD26
MIENPRGAVGEIWVHGERVAIGYWRKPEQTARTFNAKNVNPASGTPEGPWLRTGDLGVISDGELFIYWAASKTFSSSMAATPIPMTSGRRSKKSPAAGSRRYPCRTTPPSNWWRSSKLKRLGASAEEVKLKLRSVRREVTFAVFKSHSLGVADLVLVSPGSIPITTSGRVRRSACVERYRGDRFKRLDVTICR